MVPSEYIPMILLSNEPTITPEGVDTFTPASTELEQVPPTLDPGEDYYFLSTALIISEGSQNVSAHSSKFEFEGLCRRSFEAIFKAKTEAMREGGGSRNPKIEQTSFMDVP